MNYQNRSANNYNTIIIIIIFVVIFVAVAIGKEMKEIDRTKINKPLVTFHLPSPNVYKNSKTNSILIVKTFLSLSYTT